MTPLYPFDPFKDLLNQSKHGVSLAAAEFLFAGRYVAVADDRFDYGEERQVAFGRIGARLFVCVFVDRGGQRRIISLRKANTNEVKRYGQAV